MMEVLDRPTSPAAPNLPSSLEVGVDEAGARRSLRRQIARLERELSEAATSAFPRTVARVPPRPSAGPGILTIGELEEARGDPAGRPRRARGDGRARGARRT